MVDQMQSPNLQPDAPVAGRAHVLEHVPDLPGVLALAGVVKWFDAGKGYGFIAPDNGMSDLFLHGTCLLRDGFTFACKGCRIAVEAVPGPRGWQVLRILSLDSSAVPVRPAVPVPVIASAGPFERARVKWINRIRGFGFLTRGEGTPDVFVHVEMLRRSGLTDLRAGQHVRVRVGQGPKGAMAAELRPEETLQLAVH